MTEETQTTDLKLKLVVTTMIWSNSATDEMPLWKTVGGKEYIIARFDYEPTITEIGKACEDSQDRRYAYAFHNAQGLKLCFPSE